MALERGPDGRDSSICKPLSRTIGDAFDLPLNVSGSSSERALVSIGLYRTQALPTKQKRKREREGWARNERHLDDY